MNMIHRTACGFRMTVWHLSRKDSNLRVASSISIYQIANGWQSGRYMSANEISDRRPGPEPRWGSFYSESQSWRSGAVASHSWSGRR